MIRRAALLLVAALGTAPIALAEPPPQERFLRDGDARTFAASLAASADPRDRDDAGLALLAVDATAKPAGDASPFLRAVHALRTGDLAAARRAAGESTRPVGVADAFVDAVALVRVGEDEAAVRALLRAPAPDGARDRATLTLLGRCLAPDDRRILAGAVRLAVLRAASQARLDAVEALGQAAGAFDGPASRRVALLVARALRRGGAPDRALAFLGARTAAGPSDAVASEVVDEPDLRLERSIAAWQAGGASAPEGTPSVPSWAYEALARAKAFPAPAAAAPGPLHVEEDELHAAALARLATLGGVPTRTEDVVARAASQRQASSDPRFSREWLARAGFVAVELAGDAEAMRLALAQGFPALLHVVARRGDAFRDPPFVVRARDATTGLLVGEPLDLGSLDVLPETTCAKARLLVAVPRARAAEAAALSARPAARLGAALAEALAGGGAGRLASLPAADAPALDLYAAFLAYPAAMDRGDGAALAEVRAAVARSSGSPPVTAFEHYVLALAAPDAERALRSLDAALAAGGESAWLRTARFVTLSGARRTGEALAELDRALVLDPLDTKTMYFRASTKRLLGDREGARADLTRVLDRRPGYVAAAEDLVRLLVDDGRVPDALAAVERLERADPAAASSERVRAMRRAVEAALVRGAAAPEDLRPLVRSPEADTRRKAALALAGFETPAAEASLRALLADPDEGVRVTATRGYLRPWLRARATSDPAVYAAISALLTTDRAATVRSAAAVLLGSLESPAARAAVAARIAGPGRDPAPTVRAAAADALSGRDAPEARPALVAALSDEDLDVRRAAIRSLHRIAATTFGYVADDPPERRAPCVAEWGRWAAGGN